MVQSYLSRSLGSEKLFHIQTVLFCAQDPFAASTLKMSWTLYCWQYALRTILPRSMITPEIADVRSFGAAYVANGYQKNVNIPKIVNNSMPVLVDVMSFITRIVHSVLFLTTDCVWDLQFPLSAICMTVFSTYTAFVVSSLTDCDLLHTALMLLAQGSGKGKRNATEGAPFLAKKGRGHSD